MFSKKVNQLFPTSSKKRSTGKKNPFIKAALENQAVTLSGNGAKKYSTTGDVLVDQFGLVGTYKPTWDKASKTLKARSFAQISKDCELAWSEDRILSVRFITYLRMITRQVELFNGTKTNTPQKGAEMKHEGIMRMIWLHFKSPKTFWKNIALYIAAGCWNDIFTMLRYDLEHHGWEGRKLNWNKFGELLLSGLENEKTTNLVKKFLPQIRNNNSCKTLNAQANNIIAKWICALLFGKGRQYAQYRKLKTSGNAHTWQQLISRKEFNRIDFNKIHGRALKLLSRSKFFENQGLSDKYEAWITNDETEAKFTGFVCELFQKIPHSLHALNVGKQTTINKQFNTLVKKAGQTENTSLIVVRDTSGSMGSDAIGIDMSCYNVAKALALYFSEFLTGAFEDAWIEFDNKATMHTWKGNSPLEKWYNDRSDFIGGTNFQSVVELFCKMKRSGVPESDFPTGIICISDGQFNRAELEETNVESARRRLREAGFSSDYARDFVIVLWDLKNNYYGNRNVGKFETYGSDVPNVFYYSGYSASVISFLTSEIKNARELFEVAMNQELLQMIKI